jgi:inosine/xanthosine triphosphatase
MHIVLASTNKAKIMATERTLAKFFPNNNLVSVNTDSGVSTTPLNDDEGIQGCFNRIKEAKKMIAPSDMYIALEGILTKNAHGIFLCGWAIVESVEKNRIGLGCSAKVKIPDYIARNVDNFKELSDIVQQQYNSDLVNKISELGSNGIITDGKYDRVDEFEDAITCAIAYIQNENNYKSY